MKQRILALFLTFALAAPAMNTQATGMIPLQKQPSNVQIIKGQRFYSLQNVRRFNGDPNSPRAQSVMHHPRPATSNVARSPQSSAHNPNAKDAPTATTATATGNGKDHSDQVLSIFAPEDKSLSPSAR